MKRTCTIITVTALAAFAPQASSFVMVAPQSSCILPSSRRTSPTSSSLLAMTATDEPIVSPFDDSDGAATATTTGKQGDDDYLELTWDNVEKVLDEMRPYLIQDGGNVVISEIDGPVVRLELQVRSCVRMD